MIEAKMNRYGHPADHIAAMLALAGVLTFAFTLPSANLAVYGLATAAVVVAGLIFLRRWLHLPDSVRHPLKSRWSVAGHRH